MIWSGTKKCTNCIGTIIFETKYVFEAHTQPRGLVFTSEERLWSHKTEVHPHCEVCEDDFQLLLAISGPLLVATNAINIRLDYFDIQFI